MISPYCPSHISFFCFQDIPDNDQLSAQLSGALGADLLILMSDVEGVYTGHPSDPSSRLIRTYYPEHSMDVKFWAKSRVGKGGMESKVREIETLILIMYLHSLLKEHMIVLMIYYEAIMFNITQRVNQSIWLVSNS